MRTQQRRQCPRVNPYRFASSLASLLHRFASLAVKPAAGFSSCHAAYLLSPHASLWTFLWHNFLHETNDDVSSATRCLLDLGIMISIQTAQVSLPQRIFLSTYSFACAYMDLRRQKNIFGELNESMHITSLRSHLCSTAPPQ